MKLNELALIASALIGLALIGLAQIASAQIASVLIVSALTASAPTEPSNKLSQVVVTPIVFKQCSMKKTNIWSSTNNTSKKLNNKQILLQAAGMLINIRDLHQAAAPAKTVITIDYSNRKFACHFNQIRLAFYQN